MDAMERHFQQLNLPATLLYFSRTEYFKAMCPHLEDDQDFLPALKARVKAGVPWQSWR